MARELQQAGRRKGDAPSASPAPTWRAMPGVAGVFRAPAIIVPPSFAAAKGGPPDRKAVSEERPLSILAAEVEPIFRSGSYFHTGPIDPVEPGFYYLAHWGDRWTLDLQELPMMFIVQTPIWPLLLTCMLLPAISLLCATVRRLRRKPPGHCPKCGYDLMGNVSGICPECGEKVIAAARKA